MSPPPLTRRKGFLGEVRRDASFFARAGYLFACYKGFQAKTHLGAWLTSPDQATIDAAWAKQHDWGGRELYRLAVDLRGYHLKGCQWLGSRPDIAPREWVAHLSLLQDRCPPLALAEVEAVVEEETGKRLTAVFSSFCEEPLGSASIAQVHFARLAPAGPLRRRRAVAVKVQRPGARELMLRDLRRVKAFLCLPMVRSSLAKSYDPATILEQVEAETRSEFDFVSEARAMDTAEDVLRRHRWRPWPLPPPPVRIPRSVEGLVTPRLLVMEALPGVPLSRLARTAPAAASFKERAVAQKLLQALGTAFGLMLFEDGFGGVHADPHPGNILAARGLVGPRVGLVDWGQTKTFDLSMRLRIARVVEALCSTGSAGTRGESEELLLAFRGMGVDWNSEEPESMQRAAAAAAAVEWFDTRPIPPPFSNDPTAPTYPLNTLGDVTDFPLELSASAAIQTLRRDADPRAPNDADSKRLALLCVQYTLCAPPSTSGQWGIISAWSGAWPLARVRRRAGYSGGMVGSRRTGTTAPRGFTHFLESPTARQDVLGSVDGHLTQRSTCRTRPQYDIVDAAWAKQHDWVAGNCTVSRTRGRPARLRSAQGLPVARLATGHCAARTLRHTSGSPTFRARA